MASFYGLQIRKKVKRITKKNAQRMEPELPFEAANSAPVGTRTDV